MYYLVFSDKPLLKLKFEIRSFASLHPKLFFPLMRLSGKYPGRAVRKNTELLIEGFPRSANSFSIGAFISAQHQPIVLASHLHAAAQIIRATRLSIPTLVLIRQPIDAVMSLLSLELETNAINYADADLVKLSLKKYLINWIGFYKRIRPKQNYYVIGLFDEVTKDFGAVIEQINQRFNTKFELFLHTKTKVKEIHNQLGCHAGPCRKREYIKEMLIKNLDDEDIKALAIEAEKIYVEFEIAAKAKAKKVSKQKSNL